MRRKQKTVLSASPWIWANVFNAFNHMSVQLRLRFSYDMLISIVKVSQKWDPSLSITLPLHLDIHSSKAHSATVNPLVSIDSIRLWGTNDRFEWCGRINGFFRFVPDFMDSTFICDAHFYFVYTPKKNSNSFNILWLLNHSTMFNKCSTHSIRSN